MSDGLADRQTISVHSSLEAVGLTAALTRVLTNRGISANVIAAFFHDHILVPYSKTAEALDTLIELRDAAQKRAEA